jgi:hypothetical protein
LRYRSLFWPGVLILVGLIALLVNVGVVNGDRLLDLITLWPLILIVIGLELIVRNTVRGPTGELAAVLIVVLAIAASVGYVAFVPSPSATHTLDRTGPVGLLTKASVEISVGSAKITMTSGAELGANLYHVRIAYSGNQPDVKFDREAGALTIDQNNNSFLGLRGQRIEISVELNSSVQWSITENTGASTDTINLPTSHVTAVQVNTGASREEITLGPASGIVPVEVDGGALTVHVHRPAGVEASVDVSGGAVSLNADGHDSHAVGELKYETPGFSGATDGYRIQVNGGACTVTLDAKSASD